jgi:hypothetical protein
MTKPFRYSTVSDFYKCGAYYKWKHVDGLDDGLGKSMDLCFGTAIHLAIQDLFEGGDGLDIFNVFWVMQRDKGLESSRLDWTALHVLGHQLIEIFRDEHMHKFQPSSDEFGNGELLIEQKMLGTIGAHKFSGTADFIGTFRQTKTSDPVLALVDWKTSALPYDSYKLQCNEQIYGYVELAKQDLGIDLSHGVYGVAVKDPKNPRWQFKVAAITPAKKAAMLANIARACDQIEEATAGNSFLRNPFACVKGKYVCPFFSKKCFNQDGASGGEEENNP